MKTKSPGDIILLLFPASASFFYTARKQGLHSSSTILVSNPRPISSSCSFLLANPVGTLGQDLKGGMGKTPSIPDKTTQQSMETCDEIAADSCGSERTISVDLGGNPYFGNQAEDDALEADSAMVLLSPAVVEKEERSDSGRRLQGDSFVQISGHGNTNGLDVDSASRTKRAVRKSNPLQYIPLDGWLNTIDKGEGIWKAAKSFRSDGTTDKVSIRTHYLVHSDMLKLSNTHYLE